MLELPRATWLLFRMHLGSIVGSRRTLIGIVLASIPPLIGFLAMRFAPDEVTGEELFAVLTSIFQVQVVVPLLSLVAGVGVIADEVDGRTITYPFTRPIPRSALLLGRWFATLVLVLSLLGLSQLGLTLAVSGAQVPPSAELTQAALTAVLLGGAVYSLGAAVLGVFFKRALIIALGYAFAIEGMLANVPGSNQRLTIQYYLRCILHPHGENVWDEVGVFLPTKLVEPSEAVTRLAIVLVVVLALGCWRIARRQFVLPA